jgi:signal transduction histidine kinase
VTVRAASAWRPCAVAAALIAVTVAIALGDPRPDALLRHGYLVIVVSAAIAGGAAWGIVAAGLAVLVHAPLVLAHVEQAGLTREAIEGLVTSAMLIAAGASTGALTTGATRERARHDTLVRVQEALAGDATLETAADRVRHVVAAGARDADVGVLIRDGDREITAGVLHAARGDLDAVLGGGPARFVPDADGGPRPRRAVLAPIAAGGDVRGVLAVSRVGELGGTERAAVVVLGAYLGLALENARLAAAQRRFADELAAKVAAATREVHAIDQAKSAFVAVASHELRTPLTALRGFSELLTIRTFATAEVQRFARVMLDETDRLGRMVDDLLDLSRLEQGLTPPLRRAAVDPRAVIRAVTDLYDRPDQPAHIAVDCEAALPRVDADPDALGRILKNLVSNAIKYAGAGIVTIGARARDGVVEFVVADEGPGIPPEAMPRLFEPYFRVEDTAGTVRGTGLGLAVVRALVEAHGGAIVVESARTTGTQMRFTIPSVP